ncbi:MAG TPA: alpha/beta hydrolase [Humibacillus xanthopallidus]|nr:alpha/beta hydrolase [Humibacillus xanthopallidus]
MSELRPRLVDTHVPDRPRGVVLVLHGGAARRERTPVSAAQLSVLRMVPVAARVARTAPTLVVQRLLNTSRGWGSRPTPVDDVRWALAEAAERFGADLPVCLVGHSLGGRAALLAGSHPAVRTVVALAPWLYPSDGAADLSGRDVLFVHGDRDRIARPDIAVQVARQLAARARVAHVTVVGGTHSMLRHVATFDGLAADFAAASLLGTAGTGLVGRALAGEQWLSTEPAPR